MGRGYRFWPDLTLRSKYPIMRHAHEKVHSRYMDGMGVQSVDPPCTGAALIGDSGEQLPCVPCAAPPSHPTMCVWMRNVRSSQKQQPERRKRHHAARRKRRHAGQQEKETEKQKQLWRYKTSGTHTINHIAAATARAIATGEEAPHDARGKGEGGRPAAKDRGKTTRVGGTHGGQVVDQREGRRAVGRESALGSGACDWPCLAMVTGAASTECH